jgi:preprotein translocase subunit SecB
MEKSVLSLGNVYIDEIQYKLNQEFKNPKKGIAVEINCALYRMRSANSFTVKLQTTLFEKELKPQMPFYLLINICSKFEWEGDLTKEQLDQFAPNMAAILYSYTRPLAAQITAFSNMPPLHMPVMDMRGIEIIDIPTEAPSTKSKRK